MLSSSSSTSKLRRTTIRTPLQYHKQYHSSTTSSSLSFQPLSTAATLCLLVLLLLLLVLVLIFGTTYFPYLFTSLSFIPHFLIAPISYALVFHLCCGIVVVAVSLLCNVPRFRSFRCNNPKCKGLNRAAELDVQVQTEDQCLENNNEVDIDSLPWKGGSENEPEYDALRAELRRMAPRYGRAVLLFRATCGCPQAKLIGWGPTRAQT